MGVPPLLPAPCSWESPARREGTQQRPPTPPRPAGQPGAHGQGVGTLEPPQPLGAGLSLPLLLLAALGLPGAGSRIPVTSASAASWPSPVSPLWLPSPSKDIGPLGLRAKPTPVGPRCAHLDQSPAQGPNFQTRVYSVVPERTGCEGDASQPGTPVCHGCATAVSRPPGQLPSLPRTSGPSHTAHLHMAGVPLA